MEEIIEAIVSEMKNQGISATKLENDTGIGKNTIAVWKRGTQPTVDKLFKVIRYLNMSADELFKLNKSNNSDTSKALEEIKYMRKVFNYILDSDDIEDIHEMCVGALEYAMKEYKLLMNIQ